MNIAIWILQAVVSAAFLGAGAISLLRSKVAVIEGGLGAVEELPAPAIKAVGAVELVGAVGVSVPAATGIMPILSPWAATGLALVMGGAIALHVRRNEAFIPALALGAACVVIAVLRFGPYAL